MSRKKFMYDLKFLEIVPRLMEKAGMRHYNELAKLLDIKPQSINQFRMKNRFPTNQVVNFAIKTNTSVDELLNLKPRMEKYKMAAGNEENLGVKGLERRADVIIRYALKESGERIELESILMELGKKWIEDFFGENKNHLIVWAMNADNMSGPYKDSIDKNSVVFIDTRIKTVDGAGIYAFGANGKIIIRRVLETVHGGIDLINDNPAYGSVPMMRHGAAWDSNMEVLGRVVFVGRTLT